MNDRLVACPTPTLCGVERFHREGSSELEACQGRRTTVTVIAAAVPTGVNKVVRPVRATPVERTTTFSSDQIEVLAGFVSGIAAQCDYANEQDGVGFSSADAVPGHTLASVPVADWDDTMTEYAAFLAVKYQTQGVTSGLLPETFVAGLPSQGSRDGVGALREWRARERAARTPAGAEPNAGRREPRAITGTVTVRDGRVVFRTSRYLPILVDTIKKCPYNTRKWDGTCWTVTPAAATGSVLCAIDQKLDVSEEVVDLIAGVDPTAEPVRTVKLVGKEVAFETLGRDDPATHAIRGFPDRRWDREKGVWMVPINTINASRLVGLLSEMNAEIAPELHEALLGRATDGAESVLASVNASGSEIDYVPPVGFPLYGYQSAGIAQLVARNKNLLTDEQGLGKTVQALVALQIKPSGYPAMIGTTAKTVPNWVRESKRWTPNATITVVLPPSTSARGIRQIEALGVRVVTTPDQLETAPKTDLTIIAHGNMSDYSDVLANNGFNSMVLDEAHNFVTETTQRARAADKINRSLPADGNTFLLSGTLNQNRAEELIVPLHLTGMLDTEFQGKQRFLYRYGKWAPKSRLAELNERLRSTCMIRREKSQVLTDLPPKRYVDVDVEGSPQFWDTFNSSCEWYSKLPASEKDPLQFIQHLDRITRNEKKESAVEWAKTFLEEHPDRKLIVFAWHHEMLDAIHDEIPDAVRIDGNTTSAETDTIVEKFQNDPNQRVFIGQIKACGEGLTLTAAQDALFVERPWNPGKLDQAADRMHRIGQTGSVTAHMLTIPGSYDTIRAQIIASKREIVEQSTGTERFIEQLEAQSTETRSASLAADAVLEAWRAAQQN